MSQDSGIDAHMKIPNLESIVTSLKSLIGSVERVQYTAAVLEQHSHDESHHRLGKPDVVVKAESVEDVSKVVSFCNQHKLPVIPFGGGTGLEGGVSAPKGGISLDLSSLNQILVVNADDFDCTVQCAVTRLQLNNYLRDTGLFFPVDPGAEASLGGMCATSASGTNAVRYGTMRENVLNLQVVLANGDVIHTRGEGRHVRKSAAGYNLTNLFIGSEGTLGIITAATLKLYGIPECISVAVVPFSTVRKAVDAVVQILQNCVPVSRIEFLDEVQIEACNKYSKLYLKPTPTLFLEFQGSLSTMQGHIERAKDICSSLNGENCEFNWASSKEEREKLWAARHNAYYACLALKPGSKGFITDVCVPISKLPETITFAKTLITESGLTGPIVGHVGDGNFHIICLVSDESEEKRAQALSDKVVELALKVGGTCTGEHGVGYGKKRYLEKELGSTTLALMKSLKSTLDPNNILNPEKVL